MRTLRLFKERGISQLTIGGLYEEIIELKFVFILYVCSISKNKSSNYFCINLINYITLEVIL